MGSTEKTLNAIMVLNGLAADDADDSEYDPEFNWADDRLFDIIKLLHDRITELEAGK